MEARTYLTVPETARLLGLTRGTVANMVVAGKLPAYQPAGPRGRYRILVTDFLAYIAARRLPEEEEARIKTRLAALVGPD